MANSVDPDQTAPIGAVWSWSTPFASILNLSVMLGNYLQQTTSADEIFRCIFFLVLKGLKCILLSQYLSHILSFAKDDTFLLTSVALTRLDISCGSSGSRQFT